jgi:hypothetical protein
MSSVLPVLGVYVGGLIIGGIIVWLHYNGREDSNTVNLQHVGHTSKMKRLWLIWCRTVDHRIGKTNDDEPQIPILSLKQANASLIIRTLIVVINIITCFFIITNIIHHW